LLWPVLTATALALPRPGGPADWLASTIFLGCALLAVRAGVLRGRFDWRSLSVVLFYVAASAAATAVSFLWHPLVLGARISIRGIALTLLVLSAVAVLKANGRPLRASHVLLAATAIAASSVAWPTSELLWCGLPPILAVWLYAIESKTAAKIGTSPVSVDPSEVPVDLDHVPASPLSSTRNGWL
jgi:hypothetical protein